jgi:uncharacterized protein YndB with AHSA1/START domain
MMSEISGNIEERQIVTIRVFDATVKEVFNAWKNPELLRRWWGPQGFTNTFHVFDARPGGLWKFTMHGPDGGHYHNESVFVEIDEPKRIVLDHISKPRFLLTADFEDQGNQTTKLIFQQLFETVDEYDKVKVFAVDANEENMDRLAAVLKATV